MIWPNQALHLTASSGNKRGSFSSFYTLLALTIGYGRQVS
jgi:hypothetical protein